MPTINQNLILDITPEKYLRACSQAELIELDLLLTSPYYASKMQTNEPYCRLHHNGAIDKQCNVQCKDCQTKSPDDLLKQNFVLEEKVSGVKTYNVVKTIFEHYRAKRFLDCFQAYKANRFEKNDTKVIVLSASNDIDACEWQLEITSSKNVIEELLKIGEYMY